MRLAREGSMICRMSVAALTLLSLGVMVVGATPATIALDPTPVWDGLGAAGTRTHEPGLGYRGADALRLSATEGEFGVAGPALAVAPWKPNGLKVLAWVKLEQASGDSFLGVELLDRGKSLGFLKRGSKLSGDTPGWIPQWIVADFPPETRATHFRVVLRSDDNPGRTTFSGVTLKRLPSNRPVVDGRVAPPARGAVTVRDGHLVDGQGGRIRLWGVNCVDELGRDYREITAIVRRIKAMGFNAVRLHLYDVRLIDTDARTAAGEPTSRVFRTGSQRGDGSLPDLMDYFIYRAEREGLYLYLTFDRGRAAFRTGDYDVLPPAGPDDEKQWKEAVSAANQGWASENIYYVDERLGAAHLEYARQHLNHRNAYTGQRVADDPYVALWELTNENGFPLRMLDGGFRQWPEYFQQVAQRRWNSWLWERYGTQEMLRKAWGVVREGESLAAGTIAAAPHDGEADEYPAMRHSDFREFVYDLTVGHSRRLEGVLKQEGAVSAQTPVSYDTIFEHKHAWYHPMSQGSFQAVGQYVGGSLEPRRRDSWLGRVPQALYNYSNATVADKPIVVYENNIMLPAADRAYYPMLISTFASSHDWDGVFWYVWADGTVHDQVDDEAFSHNGLRYSAPSHIWHGIVTCTDEAKLASLRLGGELFTRFVVPPQPNPVLVTAGANDLLGRTTWLGDLDVPYPPDAPQPYPRAYAQGATDFVHGTRYRYDPEQPRSSVSRPLIARVPEVCSPAPGLTYDFRRGVIVVDRPEAKAVVGFTGGKWRFRDGTKVDAGDCPFFCYGIVSQDGQPLASSRRAVMVFTTSGDNRGMKLRDNPDDIKDPVPYYSKVVASWGYGPPDLLRPAVRFALPGEFTVRPLDFLLDALPGAPTGPVREWRLPEGQELFWAELATD